jgi:hypothetical protein
MPQIRRSLRALLLLALFSVSSLPERVKCSCVFLEEWVLGFLLVRESELQIILGFEGFRHEKAIKISP